MKGKSRIIKRPTIDTRFVSAVRINEEKLPCILDARNKPNDKPHTQENARIQAGFLQRENGKTDLLLSIATVPSTSKRKKLSRQD